MPNDSVGYSSAAIMILGITLPPDAIYAPNNIAVRMVAHQLATLTDETAGQTSTPEQKVESGRLLSVLLEEKPGKGM
jgi:hypothetical protein